MALFKSGNPALNKDTFVDCKQETDETKVMTISGTVNKTAFLLFLTIVSSYITWHLFFVYYDYSLISTIALIGSLLGLALAFFISFNKDLAGFLSPLYAIFEGLALGGLSAAMESKYPGIVLESLILTFSIFIVLLIIYKLRLIEVSENFKLIIASAVGGIALYYLSSIILSFLNINLPLLHENTTGGIIFNLFVVVIAALNLVVDFDFIEQGVEKKVPKYMEWYGAFGLLVTIIWLYVEILRLLGKSRKR